MLKETTSIRLKSLMRTRHLRQVDILNAAIPYAEKYAIKMNKSDISQYVSGKVVPSQEKLAVLGLALNVSPVWLMGYDVPIDPNVSASDQPEEHHPSILRVAPRHVPMLGTIACGEPIFAEEDFTMTVAVGADIDCDFALRCSGDSMKNARILDGDIVFIKKQDTVKDGEIAAVLIDDEATLKRVRRLPGGILMLSPENNDYEPIFIGGEDETRVVRILGKAVAFQGAVI